jgi:ATP-dependent Lon protease
VILPERNRKDLEEVSQDVRSRLEFIFASDVSEVLKAALDPQVVADGAVVARSENDNHRPSLQ